MTRTDHGGARDESLFTPETRARALEVLGDTDTWTGSDWQRAAIHLASAVVAVAGDLDRLPPLEYEDDPNEGLGFDPFYGGCNPEPSQGSHGNG